MVTDPISDTAAAQSLPAAPGDAAQRLLGAVHAVAAELRQPSARLASLGLDDSLERDYGLDSLARVELLARVGQAFGVQLDEAALTQAP